MNTSTFTAHSHPEASERIAVVAEQTSTALAVAGRKTFPCDEKLRAEVIALRDAPNSEWSNTTIGRAIGRTDGTISPYLGKDGNTYTGDTKDLERRLRAWLRELRVTSETQIPTVASEVSGMVEDWLEEVRQSRGLGVLVAPSGMGKSRGIARYIQEHPLAILLQAWEGECSRARVEGLLFDAANVMRSRGRGKAAGLVERMKDSKRLIIVDDAHYLTNPALSLLCGFRDRTGMPLALVGISRLVDKLGSDPQRLSRNTYFYQIEWADLQRPGDLLSHHLDALAPEAKGDDRSELRRLCSQMATREGHFRSVCLALLRAVRLRRGDASLGWPSALRKAHGQLVRGYRLN